MPYLVDGYNLLHAIGILRGRVGPQGLEKARRRLLGWLRGSLDPKTSHATVVFDAAHAPAGAPVEEDVDGICVLFAGHREQADDLIEELIRRDSDPHRLVVVSDDHRILQAARRRKCVACKCLEFVEELERERRSRQREQLAKGEKPELLIPEEIDRWIDAFDARALESDLRELNPFRDLDMPNPGL